jgi:hypothetical protein
VKTYKVEINGLEHTLRLSDEDAKARGLTAEEPKAKKSSASSNKSRTAKNKSA